MTSGVPSLKGRGRPAFDQVDASAASRFKRVSGTISIKRDGTVPLWRQIALQLETVIRDGELKPHSRMPSEEALAETFGVSRPVIRNALKALEDKGLVVKIHRKGVFVGASPLDTDFLTSNISLFDYVLGRGHQLRTKTFEFLRSEPDDQERDALQLGPKGTVIRIGRIFWIDDRPITYAHIALNGDRLPGFEALDIENKSILGLIREHHGLRLKRADRWFMAKLAPRSVADAMNVASMTPMIWIESVAYADDNTPLEYYRAYYHSDTARIHLSIVD